MKKVLKKRKTKVERRLEVVKDAIKQLRRKNILAKEGDVVNVLNDDIKNQLEDSDQVQLVLKKLFKKKQELPVCRVCARGALLISTIHKQNAFTGKQFYNISSASFAKHHVEDQRLLVLFSSYQLQLIEEAFEQGAHYDSSNFTSRFNSGISEENAKKAHKFHDRYKNDNNRLLAILTNIVKNKGLFKP